MHTDTHNSRNPTASSLVILIGYSDGVVLWTPSWQTELESKRGTEGGRKGEENRHKKPLPSSQLPQPPLVDGTGSFLSILLIGHPGIDSGMSSTPKHVHVPHSHETPPGYSPLTLPFQWLGACLLPWQMEATKTGDGESILPQVQKQSSFKPAIFLSAAFNADTHTEHRLS